MHASSGVVRYCKLTSWRASERASERELTHGDVDDAGGPEAESRRGRARGLDLDVVARAAAAVHAGVEPVLHQLAAAVALPVLGVLW